VKSKAANKLQADIESTSGTETNIGTTSVSNDSQRGRKRAQQGSKVLSVFGESSRGRKRNAGCQVGRVGSTSGPNFKVLPPERNVARCGWEQPEKPTDLVSDCDAVAAGLDEPAKTILFHMLAELDGWGQGIIAGESWAIAPANPFRRGWNAARIFSTLGSEYSPGRWLNRPLDQAEVKAFSRAAEQLEADGSIIRQRSAGRTTHVAPTARGLRVALLIAGPNASRQNIAAAISSAEWADAELKTIATELAASPAKK